METYSVEHVPCPSCGDNVFTEEICEQFCMEPFNGTIENCPSCEAKLSLDMRVSVTKLGEGNKVEKEDEYFNFG